MIDKLKTWEYYYDKLPLYMKNSYGIPDHFYMIFKFMEASDVVQTDVLKTFDIMSNSYEQDIIAKYSTRDGYDFKFLDMIAALYGMNRSLTVTYIEDGTEKKESLNLTNHELLMLIKSRLIQNSYDGTYEQAKEYYEKVDLPVELLTDETSAATALVYLDDTDSAKVTDNIKALFKAGFFTIESMGIRYMKSVVAFDKIGKWADSTTTESNSRLWDVAVWA